MRVGPGAGLRTLPAPARGSPAALAAAATTPLRAPPPPLLSLPHSAWLQQPAWDHSGFGRAHFSSAAHLKLNSHTLLSYQAQEGWGVKGELAEEGEDFSFCIYLPSAGWHRREKRRRH